VTQRYQNKSQISGPRGKRTGLLAICLALVLGAALFVGVLAVTHPPAGGRLAAATQQSRRNSTNMLPLGVRFHHRHRARVTHSATTASPAPKPSSASPAPSPVSPNSSMKPYVQPGTQGYKGSVSDLAMYSAANGKVPHGTGCRWTRYKYLDCPGTNLTLDHVHIAGGVYWRGCGKLTVSSSIVDWQPSKSWFLIDDACRTPQATSTITVTHSTLETGHAVPT
jgi:hypothetical protein